MTPQRLTALSDNLHKLARELEQQADLETRLLAFEMRLLADKLSDMAKKEAAHE